MVMRVPAFRRPPRPMFRGVFPPPPYGGFPPGPPHPRFAGPPVVPPHPPAVFSPMVRAPMGVFGPPPPPPGHFLRARGGPGGAMRPRPSFRPPKFSPYPSPSKPKVETPSGDATSFRRHTLEILYMIWLRLDNLNALMGTVLEAVNKHKEDDDNFPVQEPTASYNTFMESDWKGRKGKAKFQQLQCVELIYQAVKRNPRITTTRHDIEEVIKTWLRHAAEKLRKLEESGLGNIP
ncbi:uncharacterized protein ISCGN_006807 [Ixodes scapularis]